VFRKLLAFVILCSAAETLANDFEFQLIRSTVSPEDGYSSEYLNGPGGVSQNASLKEYLEAEIRSVNHSRYLNAPATSPWNEKFKAALQSVSERLAGGKTPFGSDLSSIADLNFLAEKVWIRMVENYSGNIRQVREAYLKDQRLGPTRSAHNETLLIFGELKASLELFLNTSILEGPALYKNYSLIPRSVPLHPLLVQLLVELIANQKINLIADKREEITKNAIWQKIDGADFYRVVLNQEPNENNIRFDHGMIDGRWLPVLTGPLVLRNSFLLLGLHAPFDGQEGCDNWGLFPVTNHAILFHTSVFDASNIVQLNFDLPRELRDGYRFKVGDLREIANDYVYESIKRDCPRLLVPSFPYQHEYKLVKKYREIWKNLR
jgi:hypothetical protein